MPPLMLRVLCLLTIFLAGLPLQPARADGKIFRPVAVADDPWIPDQRALLHWMDGEETLVIETSVNGGGAADQELAWVVPLPSLPEVEEAPSGLFPLLSEAMGPKFKVETAWWFPFLTLPALRWWAKRTRRGFAFRLMVVLLLWAGILALAWRFQPKNLYFAILTLLTVPAVILTGGLDSYVTEAGKLRWSLCLAIVSLLLAALGILGFFSYGKIMAGGGGPVTVLGITQAGRFDVTLLRAEDSGALARWMTENGYHLPAETRPAMEAYVRDGWVFSAIKARRAGDRSTGPLHPVTFRFKSDKPVYPMRLTASGTAGRPLALDLFVFGLETAAVPGMAVKRAALTYAEGKADHDLEEQSGGARNLRRAPDEIRRWFGEARAGTWLRGVFSVAQMSRDIVPVWTGLTLHDPEVTTPIGAVHGVMNRITAVLFGLWVAARLHRAWMLRENYWEVVDSLPRKPHPLLCSLAIVGLVWCLAWSAFLEVTPVKQHGGNHQTALRSIHEGWVLKGARYGTMDVMQRIQEQQEAGKPMDPMEQAEAIQAFLKDTNFANNNSGLSVDPSTVLSQEGSRGTEIWYQSASAGRIHVATWDQKGVVDLRPGRMPVWELPGNRE